ncbi:RNA dependent RNA polymerase-domain-containing protein [Mycena pura]|uniref:RNA-dependent RNA polymerase n=1 Tax=Mycena pura TaxID=153505 RepID=A0AAD6XYS1_9AGAR|nr:RNA dependent RNA polymerase-domain-containing protein [Mycena pura]
MYTKTTLAKKRAPFVRLLLDLSTENANVVSVADHDGHESRAVRLVGDSTRFMVISFTKTSKERYLKSWLEENTKPGECIAYEGAKHLRYVFLGFTENNLKAGHILFFREGPDFTVEELRDHFGTDLKEIEPEDRQLLPDLTADDGSLTSDGCGLIRESYAHDQSRILGVPLDTAVFQIRLGGIKGTVTSCPDLLFDRICRSNGKKIAYRSSMVKYNEGPHVLEVQNVSRAPRAGRLNKQFIVLLLTLGIPLSVFEELLQMQLSEIDAVTTHREKALECVDGEVDAEASGFHQELYEMLLAGHDMNEPYLAILLRRFQTTARDALRSKLNIPVKSSGYLLGVVDYCGVLKEGEVYMNLPTRGGTQVGPVVLMRNPAYDTNGVRVLNGVNKPKLRHLTNCIVFAATGAHSETDRMGGGDLDGDQYFFITDPSLIPQRRATLAPSTSPRPITRSQTITMAGRTQTVSHSARTGRSIDMRADAIQTFLTLRCNFLLGSISNEWMARVGSTPALADSPACRALIPMLEAALDIVKSGGSPAILRSNFELFKTQHAKSHPTEGWRNPLDILAAHVPSAPPTSAMDFACDPQLVLQKNVSADRWDELVRSAEGVMREYNRALSVAIAADKDAKLYGLQEDEKRADMAKADVIARHFPRMSSVLYLPQYLLKASVWYIYYSLFLDCLEPAIRYFTGYKHGKQSFAWLGGRWLNYIKARA